MRKKPAIPNVVRVAIQIVIYFFTVGIVVYASFDARAGIEAGLPPGDVLFNLGINIAIAFALMVFGFLVGFVKDLFRH